MNADGIRAAFDMAGPETKVLFKMLFPGIIKGMRCPSPDQEIERLLKRVAELEAGYIIYNVMEHGKEVEGGHEYAFPDDSMPVILGWAYDEPCDIVIEKVFAGRGGIEFSGRPKDGGELTAYRLGDFAPGQMRYVYSMIVGLEK